MKVFQVGGSVRDEILGVEANDKDWVVVGSSPEKMVAEGFKACLLYTSDAADEP